MYIDVYLGRLDDPTFSWDGGDRNGNAPKVRTPWFPNTLTGREPFWELQTRIEDGVYDAKATDWGCWVARMTPGQVMEFIDEQYGAEDGDEAKKRAADDAAKLAEIRQFVRSFGPEELLALVAMES